MRLLALLATLLAAGAAQALPRMSLTAGSPCATCHVDPTGGGMRNEVGWGAMNHVGALKWDQVGLGAFHDVQSNTYLDGLIAFGFDIRLQWARFGRPVLEVDEDGGERVVEPELSFIPMQFQPYLAVSPTEWMTLYGSFAVGPETFDGKICDPVYPGQSCFFASVHVEPGPGLPGVRAGMIQPSIGVRHDDHTMLIRGDAFNRRRPLIPPNYGEYGAEVNYQPRSWFRSEVGLFGTMHIDEALNDSRETADLWPVAYLGRVTFLPRIELGGAAAPAAAEEEDPFGDDFDAEPAPVAPPYALNTWIGTSGFGSGDFYLINGYLGVGGHEGWTAFFELSHSGRTDDWSTLNGMLMATYAPWAWLVVEARAERAATERAGQEHVTWQYVGGLQFFPIPWLEVRPEYRLVHDDEFLFGQATVQIHMFY